MNRRRILRRVLIAAGLVGVLSALTYGWALASLDRSALARAIVWQSADADDWTRFPARPMESAADAVPFAPADHATEAEILSQPVSTAEGTIPLEELLTRTGTRAFLVVRGDTLLVERYYDGLTRESVSTSFSVAKSFVSALVGVAIADGAIHSVDDPVTRYVPELLERDGAFDRITIGHLLSMSSGLAYEEHGLPWSDDALTYYDPDLRSLALERTSVAYPPGERFHYNNYNPLLLGLVLERATGMSVAEYLQDRLWQPMGAEFDASWSLDSDADGFEKMESGINARAVDFARFGLLYAREGRSLGGAEVVPAEWVATSIEPHADAGTLPGTNYGYYWWINAESGNPYARGNHGQFIYVAPELDVVIVRLGNELGYEHWPALLDSLAARAGDFPRSE